MGKRSREKGKRGEREAASEVARLFGVWSRRGCQFSGTPDSPDIVTGLQGIHFEVKRCESLRIYEAVAQAVQDAGENIPVVLFRSNRNPWLAILRLDDLPRLMQYGEFLHEKTDGCIRRRTCSVREQGRCGGAVQGDRAPET